ncbi:peptidoglycan DD-metalloendopeptidase family protein [Stappia sp. BW2]|nr:peptidoglycan DD-metalloendopeptidase family protein [Stappia sp. BW2]
MKRMRTLRRDLMGKVATVSLVAVALAGCSGAVERFGEPPYYTGNTQNQRDILNGGQKQPSYQDIVNGPGGTSAGLPQGTSQPVTTGSIPSRASQVQSAPLPSPVTTAQRAAPARTAPVETLATPEIVTASSGAKSWKGWTSAGGTSVQMRQGDSLNSMARRYGVPIQAIVAVNGIKDPAQVQPGQSVIIPTYVYAERNGSTSTTDGENRKVKLPKVGRNDNVVTGTVPTSVGNIQRPSGKNGQQPTFADIRQGNVDIVHVSALPKRKPGGSDQSLTTASISSGASSGVPTPRRQPATHSSGAKAVAAAPSGTVEKTKLPQPALTQEAKPTKPIKTPTVVAKVQDDDGVDAKFRWPVRGRIISDFGAKPGGGKNEGVNLAVPEGTPVHAADDGSVIYSGNELKGYGNLILVRHNDGWVSAYAHNSELKVKRGDTIRRGDVVALAGASGSVNQPQLHFELRQGNKPVDPLKYLPRR